MNIYTTETRRHRVLFLLLKIMIVVFPVGCTNQPTLMTDSQTASFQGNSDKLMVVDCLLPGQVRKLGQAMTYLSARRPIKTTASSCEIRGGEYSAYDRANYATALKVWLPKAKNGDAEAQTYVGEIYEKGLGLTPDYKLAAVWYRKAADQGFSRAQINLGYLYEKGLGVNQDLVTALNWYRKASGLRDDDIAFASTVESAVRSEYEDEIQLLKNELINNTRQTQQLQSKLTQSQQQLQLHRSKLKQAQQELARTRRKLQRLKSSKNKPQVKQQIENQQKNLQTQETLVAQQLTELNSLEKQLKEQNEKLTAKLETAEERTHRLNRELDQHKQKSGALAEQLTITKAQLSSTEAILDQLREQYSTEKATLEAEKRRLEEPQQIPQNQASKRIADLSKKLILQNQKAAEVEKQLAVLETQKNQIDEEKRQLEKQQDQSSSGQNKQLQILAMQMSDYVKKMGKQRKKISQLNKEKASLIVEKKALEDQQTLDSSQMGKNLQSLKEQLGKREQELERKHQKIALLENDTEKYKNQIKQLQTSEPTQFSDAQPSIEIIEPPLTVTRSSTMPAAILRSAMKHREISGRVQAKLGLLSFNINGINTAVNDTGVFKSDVKLRGKETAVHTVAIDQRGNRAELEFLLIAAEAAKYKSQQTTSSKKAADVQIDFGKYHALLIGNNIYNYLPSLDTPINDVITLEKLLRDRYGFKTTVLSNANRYTILSSLNGLREKLTEKDNLLIYYAGHGELDRVNLRGHWLPVDAETDNTANWISTVAITDILNTMTAKHVLVIADSCYSGAMTRSSLARLEAGVSNEKKQQWLQVMSKTKSRTVLTSGGMKPVLDGGGGDHSVFAKILIDALQGNNQILEGQSLYRTVTDKMRLATKKINFEQTPQYAPIRHAGHESGEFFFVPKTWKLSKVMMSVPLFDSKKDPG